MAVGTEIQALLLLKASLESANLHGVEAMLDDDCEYVSTGRGIIARNKRESLEFLTAMVDSIQSDHVPVICRITHIGRPLHRLRSNHDDPHEIKRLLRKPL